MNAIEQLGCLSVGERVVLGQKTYNITRLEVMHIGHVTVPCVGMKEQNEEGQCVLRGKSKIIRGVYNVGNLLVHMGKETL
jgi:hypothetical protein